MKLIHNQTLNNLIVEKKLGKTICNFVAGSVRRPSLELVDSSSFRTHSSDNAPDRDQSSTLTEGTDTFEPSARGNQALLTCNVK